jgi:hypothetical protein
MHGLLLLVNPCENFAFERPLPCFGAPRQRHVFCCCSKEGTIMAGKKTERVVKSLRNLIKQIDRLHARYGNLDLSLPIAERLAARKPARGGAGHEEDHNG